MIPINYTIAAQFAVGSRRSWVRACQDVLQPSHPKAVRSSHWDGAKKSKHSGPRSSLQGTGIDLLDCEDEESSLGRRHRDEDDVKGRKEEKLSTSDIFMRRRTISTSNWKTLSAHVCIRSVCEWWWRFNRVGDEENRIRQAHESQFPLSTRGVWTKIRTLLLHTLWN